MHGYGRLVHANREVYEGEFVEDKATGLGKYINMKGEIYEGYFLDN